MLSIDALTTRLRPPDSARPAVASPVSPLGSLVYRPAVWSRNEVRYVGARRWASTTKRSDLEALKAVKRELPAGTIDGAGDELARLACVLFGAWPGVVAAVAPGHSRRSDNFAVRLAWRVAAVLAVPFVQVFADRFVSGSSHPRTFDRLPPLQWATRPAAPVLLVDDLATSGFHMEEALTMLRSTGETALGMVWIAGEVKP